MGTGNKCRYAGRVSRIFHYFELRKREKERGREGEGEREGDGRGAEFMELRVDNPF